ncbi:MAG: pseudouridine synthase [Patescibacteria group bacterium]
MNDQLVRLQKYLADCGLASRRRAEVLISTGRVKVNGKVIKAMGVKVDPTSDKVTLDGKLAEIKNKIRTIMLYKPVGALATTRRGREQGVTVTDLVPTKERLFIAGRLDRNSEGMMILTNDGDLAWQLTHPSQEHEKEYVINVQEKLQPTNMRRLIKGVNIAGESWSAKRAWISKTSQFHIVLTTGKKHQIKRMAEAIQLTVRRLKRVRMGGLRIEDLKPGRYRVLNNEEISMLRQPGE